MSLIRKFNKKLMQLSDKDEFIIILGLTAPLCMLLGLISLLFLPL